MVSGTYLKILFFFYGFSGGCDHVETTVANIWCSCSCYIFLPPGRVVWIIVAVDSFRYFFSISYNPVSSNQQRQFSKKVTTYTHIDDRYNLFCFIKINSGLCLNLAGSFSHCRSWSCRRKWLTTPQFHSVLNSTIF